TIQPHCAPVRVSRSDRSFQFGRASGSTMPHDMHTMRGPKASTGIASPSASLSTIPCPPLCLDQPFTDGDSDRLSPVYRAELTGGGLSMLIDSSLADVKDLSNF